MQLKANIPKLSYSWEDHASNYPDKGRPGTTYRKIVEGKLGPDAISEALLYYDTDGSLAGILNYFPNDIPVREAWMRPFVERAGNLWNNGSKKPVS
jgi:hypothetical protein